MASQLQPKIEFNDEDIQILGIPRNKQQLNTNTKRNDKGNPSYLQLATENFTHFDIHPSNTSIHQDDNKYNETTNTNSNMNNNYHINDFDSDDDYQNDDTVTKTVAIGFNPDAWSHSEVAELDVCFPLSFTFCFYTKSKAETVYI